MANITYADKVTGSLFTATDANEIKTVVNNKADATSITGLLNETAHDNLDHTGLPGVPSITGLLNETAHDNLDHTGLPGVPTQLDTSLEPAPGKIPVAGTDGLIGAEWIRPFSNDIGNSGSQGFGVGICPSELPAGMATMTGTLDVASDNYGNYQYSDGSIMCWIPAFYYKYGDGTNGLAVNMVDIKPYSTYDSVTSANTAGYALHRAFYDEGVIQPGFFVDKYIASNNGGIASSIKNGAPLSSHADHNPFSGLTGAPPNSLSGAFAASKTRGAGFFPKSIFINSALALLSLAHGQAATATTWCAWYDVAGITNFPKGNNNNALGDTNDATVSYTSDGYLNCGLTGSGLPFAKTTHNGQVCGVADLNGTMFEISSGLTCVAPQTNITGATQANPCVLTVVGHSVQTGGYVTVRSIVGMTQLNDKIYTATVIDANTISLDGVDSTGFTAYSSGGDILAGTFKVIKPTVALKNITGGNTVNTDHWGTAGLAANFDDVNVKFVTTYPSNVFTQRFGSGGNQVLSPAVTGNDWTRTGSGVPIAGGVSISGSNLFGADFFYQHTLQDLCPLAGGTWSSSTNAGVWGLHMAFERAFTKVYVGFRSALYL